MHGNMIECQCPGLNRFMTTVAFKRKQTKTGRIEKLSGTAWKTTRKTTQKIIEAIKKNPFITRKELAFTIGISEEGIKFHINKLKKQKMLKRVGPDKGGQWRAR